ncbi:MAG: NTP transferase domain-containing protein [Candidatus Parcubacteria bacterium]|nr:NTP transferase domain-containing protein [Candidatus Parcubacteria bacterium]
MQNVKIIILAGGKGKRLQSELPKVLVPVANEGMIKHLLKSVEKSNIKNVGIVVGHGKELVIKELGGKYEYIIQDEQLGTGHAVMCAKKHCEQIDHIVVLQGDMPFITEKTINHLIQTHLNTEVKITFATTIVPDFTDWHKSFLHFGRILRIDGKVDGIREYKDASEKEKNIKEVNAGCYVFDTAWLWKNLEKIKNENSQKEYYLTDIFHIASENNDKIETVKIDPREALGANTKEELETLEKFIT